MAKSVKKRETDTELKVRIPRTLSDRVNKYRHAKELDAKRDAVIELLEQALDAANVDGALNTNSHVNDRSESTDTIDKN